MQPLFELTLTRAWHWGIAILGVPGAELPELSRQDFVSAGDSAIVIAVRHAQDIEGAPSEGDRHWATATFHIRSWPERAMSDGKVVREAVLVTEDERLSLGDADGEVLLPSPSTRTRVIISADDQAPAGLESVWVDLSPADA